MPAQAITPRQEALYMKHRSDGLTQEAAAAKAGVSERSGRRIEKGQHGPREEPRAWRTRADPLVDVWASELEPLLVREPSLTGLTLLEYLDDNYPGRFSASVLRTLQRRVRQWSALQGPDKAVMFRQQAVGLVQHLQQAKRDLDLMAAMTKLDKYRVIVIDDIGYVKKVTPKPMCCLSSLPIATKPPA